MLLNSSHSSEIRHGEVQNTAPCFYALAEDAPFPHECTVVQSDYLGCNTRKWEKQSIANCLLSSHFRCQIPSGHPVQLSISAEIRVAKSPREKWAPLSHFSQDRRPVRCLCNVERHVHVIASLPCTPVTASSKSEVIITVVTAFFKGPRYCPEGNICGTRYII